MFYKTDRFSILIDGYGLSLAARSIDMQVDFRKLLDEFSQRGKLVHAYYYTTVDEEAEYSGIQKLIDYLSYNGFIVKTKPVKKHTDADGNTRMKGNMGVDLAVDAFELARVVDHLVLFTTDPEMTPLVERLKRLGVQVSVCASQRGEGFNVPRELRAAADNFIELEALRDFIGRNAPASSRSSSSQASSRADRIAAQ